MDLEYAISSSWRHRVRFAREVLTQEPRLLAEFLGLGQSHGPRRVLAILDEGLAAARPALERGLEAMADETRVVAGGEAAKQGEGTWKEVLGAIERAGLCRHSAILCVGGGALQDVVGFAAATAHRGIPLFRLPTTVLSQLDSGVGVKNGINAFGKKNFLGAFAVPAGVLLDSSLLATQAEPERTAGFIEAVKVALVKDAAFFSYLEGAVEALQRFELETVEAVIARSARLHLEHIALGGDPFEEGSSRPLDFGHWAAHRLEALSGFRLSHAQAVAAGLALDVVYSRRLGWLAESDGERILSLLERMGWPLFFEEMRDGPAVLNGLEEFREHLGGELTVMMLAGIGHGKNVHQIERGQMEAALAELGARCGALS
ncbi:MAG: 3-dehydroquinate synthase [Verrucomicrobiota bacterium]